jgi:hypothetical protein
VVGKSAEGGGEGKGAGCGNPEGETVVLAGGGGAKVPTGGGDMGETPPPEGAATGDTSEPTGGGAIRAGTASGAESGTATGAGAVMPETCAEGAAAAGFCRVRSRCTTSALWRTTSEHKMPQAVADARPRSA